MQGTITKATNTGRTLPAKDNWPEKAVWDVEVAVNGDTKTASMFVEPTKGEPSGEVDLREKDGRLNAYFPRGGGGGGRRTHPEDARRMSRCHAQEMALRYVVAKKIESFKIDELKPIIDWFERDVSP